MMESEIESKSSNSKKITIKTVLNSILATITIILVGLMIFQCGQLCLNFYEEAVTTNIFVDEIDQKDFLSSIQFCVSPKFLTNITKLQNLGLNQTHRYFLMNYFIIPSDFSMIPEQIFDFSKNPNQNSFDFALKGIFSAFDRVEKELIEIAKKNFNSSNPMEFLNFNQEKNILSLKFFNEKTNSSQIIDGPFITPPKTKLCYEVSTTPLDSYFASAEFSFNISVDNKNEVEICPGSFSAYLSEGAVFDNHEYIAIDCVKLTGNQITSMIIDYSVSVNKWETLSRRNRGCIPNEKVLYFKFKKDRQL